MYILLLFIILRILFIEIHIFYDHIILNKKERRIYVLQQRITWVFTRNGRVVLSFDGLRRRGGSKLWCGSVKF